MIRIFSLILLLFVLLLLHATPPVKVSFQADCHNYNSVVLTRILLQTFGKDTVKKMLSKDAGFVLGVKVDSLGYVLEVVNIVSKEKLPKSFKQHMENALIRSKTSFYICHRADMSEEEKEHMLQIEREEFKKSNCRIVSYIAFPGDLLKLYEAERQRLATSLVHLNKYEYLLSQLQLY